MTFFNEHSGSLPGILWQGQIVDDSTWKGNVPLTKWSDPDEIPGFGFRYKVRIFGRDTLDKNELPDEQLEMATVLYPVTAGSGGAGNFQTPALTKGTFVVGYYADGVDGREPVILGALANNDQIELSQTNPQSGFVPRSGYTGEKVALYSIPPGGSAPAGGPLPKESALAYELWLSSDDQLMEEDGNKTTALKSPKRCKSSDTDETKVKLENLIKDINNAQKTINSWTSVVDKSIKYKGQQLSLEEYVAIKLKEGAKEIAKSIKGTVEGIHKYTKEKANKKFKKTYGQTPPNKLPDLKKKIKFANKLIGIIFDTIIDKLSGMALKFLNDMFGTGVGKLINVPLCATENFIGGLLGSLAGFVTSSIKKLLAPIQGISSTALGLAEDILGFIKGLLGYHCPDVTSWSFWKGSQGNTTDTINSAQNIFNKAQQVASQVTSVVDPDTFNFDFDVNDLLNPFTCNTDPQPCGPPKVKFVGGNPQTPATANAIISAAGNIIGVDLISKGFGYLSTPAIKIADNCGIGKGAKAIAVMKEISPTGGGDNKDQPQYEVEKIIIPDAGKNYLQTPNGSSGGDEKVFAKTCDSTIKKASGTWDPPYEKGQTMVIEIGDTVQHPGQPSYVSSIAETIKAPGCVELPQITPTGIVKDDGKSINKEQKTDSEKYYTKLSMCEIYVSNPGLNYSSKDKLVVEPANGAKGELVLGPFGSIEKINMSQCGEGYTETPNIYIQTESGYNVELLPVFTVETVQDIAAVPAVAQQQLISVIDCVGKV
jgi:hypothetical protein